MPRYIKVGATVKSSIPNADNAVGYGYAGKAGASAKSILSHAGNAVRYGYAGKTIAKDKSMLPNAGNTVRYSVTVFFCLPIGTLYYS